ncbi:uncharacterized protein LOC126894428 [Daktulosphaira vitifoliae]|uniref:uncharacterized protein LOC126894428 n=1 Tax=Daktulosphaira vitifoliae TaxID=58002 RepID=UPI0021AA3926|nr:uncharacterized protein LOC126894428 [Daktulosphaira vitifoliae]
MATRVFVVACCCVFACTTLASASDEGDDEMNMDDLIASPPQETTSNSRTPFKSMSNIQKLYRSAKAMEMPTPMADTAAYTVVENGTSDLEWLLNVYNPHRWNPIMLPAASKLSVQCRDTMKIYLESLKKGSIWASKMADASGRYSSQLFFGNDFWLGSHTQCTELQNKKTNKFVPPFDATFYIAKLSIKLHDQLTPRTRIISLGLCMPKDCSPTDVQNMVNVPKEGTDQSYRHYNVVNVRPVPGTYSLWSDKKFYLLIILVGAVTILTIVGSAYEVILNRKKISEYKLQQINQANNNENETKIEITLEKIKAMNKMKINGEDGEEQKDLVKCYFASKHFYCITIYSHKFICVLIYRLTPAYMIVLLMAEVSARWLRNVSVFEPQNNNHVSCANYWWRNILYINSLYPSSDMCMLWSWYMSNDTQFYILGIILLLFSAKHFKGSVITLFGFLVGSWVITIGIAVSHDFKARIEEPFGLFDELYDKPWTRLGPYLFGMFTGWFLFVTKCKLRMSTLTVILGWFLSLFTLAYLVYGLHIIHLDIPGSALYASVGHSAWGAALTWIVIACCTGHGGCVNSALSFRLLQPLSRLTYCAYLVHPIIMTMTNFQMDGPLHLHNLITLILYFGNAVASFIISFFISLTFEAPVVNLLKIILAPPQRTPLKSSNAVTQDS